MLWLDLDLILVLRIPTWVVFRVHPVGHTLRRWIQRRIQLQKLVSDPGWAGDRDSRKGLVPLAELDMGMSRRRRHSLRRLDEAWGEEWQEKLGGVADFYRFQGSGWPKPPFPPLMASRFCHCP